MQTLESQNSYERIRQLVRSEGKTARNLVAWSVPAPSSPKHRADHAKKKEKAEVVETSKPSTRRAAARKQKAKHKSNDNSHFTGTGASASSKPQHVPLTKDSFQIQRQPSRTEEVCVAVAGRYSQTHSQRQRRSTKSPGRKVDLRARYWSYLFDNLHRAVDEIYQTCEADESIVECQEVLMTLDLCRRDFEALIERIQLFERSDLQSRSSNLAWEVRKTTSPTKPRPQNSTHSPSHLRTATHTGTATAHQLAKRKSKQQSTKTTHSRLSSARCLDFDQKVPGSKTSTALKATKKDGHGGKNSGAGKPTWADRVRGVHTGWQQSDGTVVKSSEHAQTNGPIEKQTEHVHSDVTVNNPRCQPRPHSADCPTNKGVEENGHESQTEEEDNEGWERVTRSRSRNGSMPRKQHVDLNTKHVKKTATDVGNSSASGSDYVYLRSSSSPALGNETITSHGTVDKSIEHAQSEGSVDTSTEHAQNLGTIAMDTVNGSESTVDVVNVTDDHAPEHAQINGTENCTVEHEHTSATDFNETPLLITLDDLNNDPAELQEVEIKEEIDTKLSQISDEDQAWNNIVEEYDAGADYRSELSWADRCDSPPEMLPEIPRSPGRAIHLHQRLSSPSRKRPVGLVEESRRLQEEKQVKAQLQRSKIHEEKAQKSKMMSDKIREVRESRVALTKQRMEALQGKLYRAERLRESHLQEIVRKAQEEETKVSEISFINALEAQNKKIEVLERHQGHEARLQELHEERQRRREEQQAKEEAAQERRKTIEAERVAKLMELDQKMKDQDAKIELMRTEREKAREEAAKEKARERERKLEARNAALQSCTEELERKIQLKHDESSRRYDQQLEQKKKAASRHASTDDAPRVEAYQKNKWCTVCNIRIISEVYLLSHLRGRKHQEALASLSSNGADGLTIGVVDQDSVIVEAPEEHQGPPSERPDVIERIKAGKKRAKKLRHRMHSRVELWPQGHGNPASRAKHRTKMQKALRDLNRQIDAASNAQNSVWEPSQLVQIDRALGEMTRTLNSGTGEDWLCFCQLGGIASVMRMLVVCMVEPLACAGSSGGGHNIRRRVLPEKTFQLSLGVLHSACSGHVDNSRYLILSNKTAPLVDLSLQLLSDVLTNKDSAQQGGVATAAVGGASSPQATHTCGPLLSFLASVISTLTSGPLKENAEPLSQAITDVLNYMVSVGLIDKLGSFLNTVTGPIGDTAIAQLVLGGLNLLVAITACLHIRVADVFAKKSVDDPTLVTTVLRQTELMGLMQLLYAILLHDGPPRHSSSPPLLSQPTLAIATAAIKAVNNCAILDLRMVQTCLGAEGISLEFRHIVSYLLWYCSHNKHTSLLHELILAVGYFCVLNHENQVFLQSGRSPTLLQLLCGLPFEYFSNPELSRFIYPTLISACYQSEENTVILEQEINCKLLVAFLQEHSTKKLNAEAEKGAESKEDESVLNFNMKVNHRFPQERWQDAIKYFTR